MAVDGSPASESEELSVAGAGDDDLAEAVGPESEPADSSESRAVRGGVFTLGGNLAVQALRMVSQMITTRLLPQEAFGLMAIVHSFRAGIDLFSDIGIGPSIVQNERGDDPRFLNTAWTIQAARGVGLFAFAAICAVPLAHFYGHQELSVLVPAASFAAIIAGLQSTKAYTAERHLQLGMPTLIELLAQVAAMVVMIAWAYVAPSVWALVAGGLVGAFVDVLLGHLLLSGHNPRPGWEKRSATALIHFGKWIFLSTVLVYLTTQADRLIFGKIADLANLGIYHVALTIAQIPAMAMHSLAGKVIFPLFSRVNQTSERLAEVFAQARKLHLVVSGWALSGLIGGGEAAIALVYDDRYESGGPMLQVIALGAWCATPEATNSSASLACGHPRWVAAANLGKLVGMFVLIPLGFHLGGFMGALIGYSASEVFRYAASTAGVYQRGLRTVSQDLRISVIVAIASIACKLVSDVLHDAGVHVVLRALGVFVVASAIWLPWLWPYLRALLEKVRGRLSA